jgi:DNA-binding TFAR19-related protein (PDSD5 family)
MDDELERLRAKRMEEIKQRIISSRSEQGSIITITQENFGGRRSGKPPTHR